MLNDNEDIKELKERFDNQGLLEGETVQNTSANTPARLRDEDNIYDIKRLLIQEKGEEDYYYLYKLKSQALANELQEDWGRSDMLLDSQHFSKHASREQYAAKVKQIMQDKERKLKEKQRRRVQGYQIGYTASLIKERFLRFMHTFEADHEPTQ